MKDQTVQIQLNDVSTLPKNIEQNQNSKAENNQKCSKLTKILIVLGILVVVIAFILILLFVIIKINDDDDDDNRIDNRIPIIIDVDEGGDDMIAYIVANNSKKYNILGITTVSSYYYVEEVGKIWLRFLEYMNFDNKVYLGEDHPLVRKTNKLPFVHYYGFEMPNTTKKYETKGGVDFMYETIKNYKKKITIFSLGPLTNLGKLFQRDKTIINNIKEIIIMGGAKYGGNVQENLKAEYNIYNDAEAAEIVFNCGIQIKIIGEETKMDFDDDFYQKLLDINTRSSIFTYYAVKGTFETWNDNWVYDPITILYHLDNDVIVLKDYYTEVNTTSPDVNGTDYGTMYFFEPNENIKPNIKYTEELHLKKCYDDLVYYLKMY